MQKTLTAIIFFNWLVLSVALPSCQQAKEKESSLIQIDLDEQQDGNKIDLLDSIPAIPQNLDSSMFINDNEIKDSLFHIRQPFHADEFNIEDFFIDIEDPHTNQIIETINPNTPNPFVNLGYKIIPNNDPGVFFFIKIPGKGGKRELEKLFSKEVYNSIPENDLFEKAYCGYMVDVSSNRFLTLAHTLDLQYSYEEVNGTGFGAVIISVIDSLGDVIYTRKVDGGLIDKPQISADGKYLAILHEVYPYWLDSQRFTYCLIRLKDDKTVYEINFNNKSAHNSGSWLNLKHNLVITSFHELHSGKIFCLDAAKDILYISKDLEGRFDVGSNTFDYLSVYMWNKPVIQKLYFERDFEIIKL